MMQSMVRSTHFFKKWYFPTCILHNDDVSIMTYVVDWAFGLDTWWIWFWVVDRMLIDRVSCIICNRPIHHPC